MKFQGNFTTAMKDNATEKVMKLSKYINCENAIVAYKTTRDGLTKVEISIGNDVRASKTGEDFYELVPDVVDKLESQIKRYKSTKLYSKRHCGIENLPDVEDTTDEITKEKTIVLDKETYDEAIDEMELLGHNFFIYKDVDRADNICVIYKRFDGTYGVIECR